MKKLQHTALRFTLSVILSVIITPGFSHANSTAFSVSPKQCTSLKQGELCQIELAVSFHLPTPAAYCLYADQQQLHCWSDAAVGQWQQVLTLKDDMVISLRSGKQQPLYHQTIRYAWMHKKNNSNAMRWRLF